MGYAGLEMDESSALSWIYAHWNLDVTCDYYIDRFQLDDVMSDVVDSKYMHDELNKKADVESVYTKEEVDNAIASIPETDLSNYYTKDEVYKKDETYNKGEVYSKSETHSSEHIDNKLGEKADVTNVYTKAEIDGKFNELESEGGQITLPDDIGDGLCALNKAKEFVAIKPKTLNPNLAGTGISAGSTPIFSNADGTEFQTSDKWKFSDDLMENKTGTIALNGGAGHVIHVGRTCATAEHYGIDFSGNKNDFSYVISDHNTQNLIHVTGTDINPEEQIVLTTKNAYTKEQVYDKNETYPANSLYTRTEVDKKVKAVDDKLGNKADKENTYTKSEVYSKRETYASTQLYNRTEVERLVEAVNVDLQEAKTGLETVTNEFAEAKTTLSTAVTELDKAKEDIVSIESRVGWTETDIDALEAKTEDIRTIAKTNEREIENIKSSGVPSVNIQNGQPLKEWIGTNDQYWNTIVTAGTRYSLVDSDNTITKTMYYPNKPPQEYYDPRVYMVLQAGPNGIEQWYRDGKHMSIRTENDMGLMRVQETPEYIIYCGKDSVLDEDGLPMYTTYQCCFRMDKKDGSIYIGGGYRHGATGKPYVSHRMPEGKLSFNSSITNDNFSFIILGMRNQYVEGRDARWLALGSKRNSNDSGACFGLSVANKEQQTCVYSASYTNGTTDWGLRDIPRDVVVMGERSSNWTIDSFKRFIVYEGVLNKAELESETAKGLRMELPNKVVEKPKSGL